MLKNKYSFGYGTLAAKQVILCHINLLFNLLLYGLLLYINFYRFSRVKIKYIQNFYYIIYNFEENSILNLVMTSL